MDQFARGDVIRISSSPKDEDGVDVTPASVMAYINYVTLDGRETATVTMSFSVSGNDYEGFWDTSAVSDLRPGVVDGSVRTVGPSSAEDFEFEILANAANPGA